jgi:hypothetical protein
VKPLNTLSVNALDTWTRAEKYRIHYVFPGSIDVELGAGIKFQTRNDSKTIELGAFLGKGERNAAMWMDEELWEWRADAADRRAQVWVKHVMVANLLQQPQGYEFEGEIVLVGTTLPTRQVERLLSQAGFRSSLATWRAKATDERRVHLPELIAWLSNERPVEPKPASPTAPTELTDLKALKERAQHVWMRWHAIFEDQLAVAGRTYQLRGRPTLGERALIIKFRHQSSAAELEFRFDVATHPLQHRTTAVFGDQTMEREALAWEEFPDFVNSVGDAIKPRSSAKKAPTTSSTSPKPATVEQPAVTVAPPPPATWSPVADIEAAQAQVRDLVLRPNRRSDYLARVVKAAERGDNSKRLISAAKRESRRFMAERAAKRSPGPRWDEALVHAFEREPGWRLDVVARGQGHTLAIYPEGRALEDAVVSIDVREHTIGDVRWLTGELAPVQEDELLGRVQRALQVARAEATGEPPPSPLESQIDEILRRAVELGINSDVLSGAPQGAMARVLEELGDPIPSAPSELLRWLKANGFGSVALVIVDSHVGDGPADMDSLSRALWKAVGDSVEVTPIYAHEGGWQTSCGALFFSRDEKRWVLVRRTQPRGAYELSMLNVVRNTDDDSGWSDTCKFEDAAGMLREGDVLCLVDGERGPQDTIELHRRISEFITELERTPKRLQDVRRLLFWTAAMIDTPRCQGAHRAAATRAFEKARAFYDTARRSLARGGSVAASESVHEALRRISRAAASIAQACAEGQQPLADRITSELSPRVEPGDEDAAILRAVETEDRQADRASVGLNFLAHAELSANGGGPPPKSPSLIQELTEMERRVKALGTTSGNLGRADELARWLDSVELTGAAKVVRQVRTGGYLAVRRTMNDLWEQALMMLPLVEVEGKPGALQVDADAIFDDGTSVFLLERVVSGERASLRRVRVQVGNKRDDDDMVTVKDPTDRLAPRADVHTAEREWAFIVELYEKLGAFHDDLVWAPKMLSRDGLSKEEHEHGR